MPEAISPLPQEIEEEHRVEKEKIETFTDPTKYWQAFVKSPLYQEAINKRVEIILQNRPQRASEPAEVLKRDAIEILQEQPSLVKDQFYQFYQEGEQIKYEPSWSGWSMAFRFHLKHYWDHIRNTRLYLAKGGGDPEYLLDLDAKRINLHGRTAQQMVEGGIVPDIVIAEKMVEFMTASEGIETLDPRRDEQKLLVLKAWATEIPK